jgi:hypothetical protein
MDALTPVIRLQGDLVEESAGHDRGLLAAGFQARSTNLL